MPVQVSNSARVAIASYLRTAKELPDMLARVSIHAITGNRELSDNEFRAIERLLAFDLMIIATIQAALVAGRIDRKPVAMPEQSSSPRQEAAGGEDCRECDTCDLLPLCSFLSTHATEDRPSEAPIVVDINEIPAKLREMFENYLANKSANARS